MELVQIGTREYQAVEEVLGSGCQLLTVFDSGSESKRVQYLDLEDRRMWFGLVSKDGKVLLRKKTYIRPNEDKPGTWVVVMGDKEEVFDPKNSHRR